jgi:hypothetical protein
MPDGAARVVGVVEVVDPAVVGSGDLVGVEVVMAGWAEERYLGSHHGFVVGAAVEHGEQHRSG